MLSQLETFGLLDTIDKLFLCNYGIPLTDEIISCNDKLRNKIVVKNMINSTTEFEVPTIKMIELFSEHNLNCKILYLHTKGISYSSHPHIEDWRNYMIYFLVKYHKKCIGLLDEYDCVGCNFQQSPFPHFSGNFWWCKTNYVKTKKKLLPLRDKHSAEWWLFDNDSSSVKYKTIYQSQINHYKCPYPLQCYENANIE
jgi:hypothetical protein